MMLDLIKNNDHDHDHNQTKDIENDDDFEHLDRDVDDLKSQGSQAEKTCLPVLNYNMVIFSFVQILHRPCQPPPQPQQLGKVKQYNQVSLHSLHSLWTLDSLDYQLSIYSKTHISQQYHGGSSWNFQCRPQWANIHELNMKLTQPSPTPSGHDLSWL